MLVKRIIVAIILFPIVLGLMLLGGWPLTLASLIVYAGINFEYYGFALNAPLGVRLRFVLLNLLLPLSYIFLNVDWMFACVFFVILFNLTWVLFFVQSERHIPDIKEALLAVCLGLCYPGILGSLIVTSTLEDNSAIVLPWIMFLVVASDSFAYAGGKIFGKNPFFSRISPNKTMEGAVCGLIGAIVVGFIAASALKFNVSQVTVVFYSLITAMLCQIGDLAESLIKRSFDIKDSGSILPGHGGILDRVDGYMFAVLIIMFCNFQ